MKARSSFLLVLLIGITTVIGSGCGCSHEWESSTCIAPETCSLCGKTDGEPSDDHVWEEATCITPKTCSLCGETDGEPLGHRWSQVVHCGEETPCQRCGETDGVIVEHSWSDATCTAPKSCYHCGETQGYPIGHNWVDNGYDMPKVCDRCEKDEGYDFLNNVGFNNTNEHPYWIRIRGYDFGKGRVTVAGRILEDGTVYAKGLVFMNESFYSCSYTYENNSLHYDTEDSVYTFSNWSNNSLSYQHRSNKYTSSILERVVNESKGYCVMKTDGYNGFNLYLSGSAWYTLAGLLDWDSAYYDAEANETYVYFK